MGQKQMFTLWSSTWNYLNEQNTIHSWLSIRKTCIQWQQFGSNWFLWMQIIRGWRSPPVAAYYSWFVLAPEIEDLSGLKTVF
jgi:hypothetical protein